MPDGRALSDALDPDASAPAPEALTPPPREGLLAQLRERWLPVRDRLMASHRFHRFAVAFPLTRPLTRKRGAALFDLCAGFVYTQVLLAAVRLRLFDALADEPLTPAELADRLGLSEDAVLRLLNATTALTLTTRRTRGRYGLGQLGATLRGVPGVAEMIEHHALLYADLEDPVALLKDPERPTRLARYWRYVADGADAAQLGAEEVGAYSDLMAASQPLVAEEILDAYPFGRHRRLLDIGGGDGAFLLAVAERAPKLSLTLFDLPGVADRAAARFEAAGLGARARAVGGSFFDDPAPGGCDLISLVRVIYDHDDAAALEILRAARRAAPPGGRLILAEPMAATPGAEASGDAYFGFYLLAMRSGRPRTPERLMALLTAAGFSRARLLPSRRPLLTRVILAQA